VRETLLSTSSTGPDEPTSFELPVLQSSVIPSAFRHGFTTRAGGVSEGPFASLNFGLRWGDDPARVATNRARLLAATARPVLAFATQVHGAAVRQVVPGEPPSAVAATQADAVMSQGGSVAVGVYVADCGPLLIADARTGAFAAVHAGWRGTVAGVLPATIEAMRRVYGSRPDDLRIAVGPCIGRCCFEVGTEVVEAVLRAWPWAEEEGLISPPRPGSHAESGATVELKPHVDLPGLNAAQARRAGVPGVQIEESGVCTSCDRLRFFSYRRDQGHTGQQAAFIAGPG